jgi:hypothetical protein
MKVQVVSQTGVGTADPIVINTNVSPVNVGFAVIVTGTVEYTIMRSYDDPSNLQNYFADANITNKTASDEYSYTTPFTALVLNVTSGTGTATMSVVQAGI